MFRNSLPTFPMDSSLIEDMLGRYVNGDSGYIGVITFFVCEAIFNAFPVHRARMKQLTSIVVGGVLGLFLLKNLSPADNVLQGILAGGAATITVAKFKSRTAALPMLPSADPVTLPQASIPAPAVPAMLEPVEHL